MFTPGMFARIRIPGSPTYQALLIPDAAISSDVVILTADHRLHDLVLAFVQTGPSGLTW
jgi:hypothetical protein